MFSTPTNKNLQKGDRKIIYDFLIKIQFQNHR
jgi:hypothetical protein